MRMNETLRSWPAPWQGDVLLACRKCQKKLKKHGSSSALSKLKKLVKRRNQAYPEAAIHVINVGCMKLCPKDAVTVCRPSRDAERLSMVRSEADLDLL